MLNMLITEQRNPNTRNIDNITTYEMLRKMNEEDKKVALAVEKELQNIAKAVDSITERIINGGRLIYVGSGTSGRLGILDASECPPTYGTDPDLVVGIIAGGPKAISSSIEGAEDDIEDGRKDLVSLDLKEIDSVVGITASGNTPYVIGAIDYARSLGALTIGLTNNPDTLLSKLCHITIAPIVGPEVITGSTRMKAGTAQKMVLNMISTGIMINYGKVYENLMVDLQATNKKLIKRAQNIIMEVTGISKEKAVKYLEETDYNCKLSLLMILGELDKKNAKEILDLNNGHLRKAMKALKL
ncbi:MAG: N-acetylmuramic acid 6-phosphate etherase [Lutispora sp.]|jgi:N-acetylmuramic acid 6-phosphate etherase|uniref:N-acetylmuramic acid 6-phosphate etherase n=1 Tax=Lutispora sp. TaxID=2828727 RepID=UPI003569BD63